MPSPTSRCSSSWKGSLLVTFDYGHQLYLHIHTHTHTYAHLSVGAKVPVMMGKTLWYDIYPTPHQVNFDTKLFYNRGSHSNRDLCVAVIKMLDPLGIPNFGTLQVPSDKLSPAQQLLFGGWEGLLRPGDRLNNTHPSRTPGKSRKAIPSY